MTPAVRQASPSPRRHGFTLVEVLAALVLIGVVLPVAMRGVALAVQAASQAKHRTEAAELARHKLSEITLTTDTSGYAGSGDFAADHPGYRWQSTYTERDYGVDEVSVEVFWTAQGTERSVKLTTLTYPNAYATPSTDTTASGTGSSTGGTTGGAP